MACHKVLNTTELTEEILLLLPLPDLLRVQAVCTQWQTVITGSSVLQEKLFLRPAKNETTWLVDITNLPSGSGPLPRQYETQVQIKASVPTHSLEVQSHHGLILTPVQLNPLCLQRRSQSVASLEIYANYGTPVALHDNILQKQLQDTSSWQDMLLTQPPVEHVTLDFAPSGASFNVSRGGVLRRANNRYFAQRYEYDMYTAKIHIKGGVRCRHIVAAMQKSTGVLRGDCHNLTMHGAVAVTQEDKDVVEGRMRWKRRREKAASSADQDTA